jgi:hypothetical protein
LQPFEQFAIIKTQGKQDAAPNLAGDFMAKKLIIIPTKGGFLVRQLFTYEAGALTTAYSKWLDAPHVYETKEAAEKFANWYSA